MITTKMLTLMFDTNIFKVQVCVKFVGIDSF